jgi:hypothetical protein
MSVNRPLRVVVWATGGCGSIAIHALQDRPDMELVGVWVHSPEKNGRDAGELAGIGPIGLKATTDAEALLALKPDCVIYTASGPERDAAAVPDYVRMLEAGINVVTVTSTRLIYPPAFDPYREQLEAAAAKGQASIYASGIFPGIATDELAYTMVTQSRSIRTVKVVEVSLNDHYPVVAAMRDGMGFGETLDFTPALARPGAIAGSWKGSILALADALGVKVDEIRGELGRELSHRSYDVAFGPIRAGTVGAVKTRAVGVVNGREAIIMEHVIRMARDMAPNWQQSDWDASYHVTIEGDPNINCSMAMGDAVGHGAGAAAMTSTAMRIVNALPYVVEARPGLLQVLDMPRHLPRHIFK